MIINPIATIAMIMPIVAGTKYRSAVDSGVGVGAGVVGTSLPTAM